MTDRSWRVVAICSLALFVPLAYPLATGRVFLMNDLGNFHLPLRYLYCNALKAGDSVLWTPSLFGGFYVHAEGQLGMFHPLHLTLYMIFPLGVAFNLEMLASYVAAYAGMYWLLRRLALSSTAALFGAMLFAFCGFNLLHFIHINVIAIVAHIPWLLAFIDLALAGGQVSGSTASEVRSADRPQLGSGLHARAQTVGVCGIALVTASEILLGFPQGVWWNLLAAGAFALARAVEFRRWRPLVPCALAIGCGVLLGGIQLVPTMDLAGHSARSLLPRDFALTYSLHPLNVLQLWSPFAFFNRFFVNRLSDPIEYPWVHEFGVYCGATALLSLPWLWVRRAALRQKQPVIIWAASFALLTFILCLGRFGGLDVLLTYLPGLSSFRAPVRYIVLVQFSLAVLAAIAFDDLVDGYREAVRLTSSQLAVVRLPLLLGLATTLLLNHHVIALAGVATAGVDTALLGILPLAAATLLFPIAARDRGGAITALVMVTAVDLGVWGLSYVYTGSPRSIAEYKGNIPTADGRTRVDCAFDCDDRLVALGYDLVEPYVALYPVTELPTYSERFQQLAGVSLEFQRNESLLPRPGAVPRARLVSDVRVSDDVVDDIWGIDIHRTALVKGALPPLGGPPGSAQLIVDRPGHLVVDTLSAGRQLLSIGERYHEGWKAVVDGHAVPVIAVNADFLGCVVEPGRHRVELRFRPRSFAYGLAASAAGVVCLALLLVLARRPRIGR